MRGDDQQQDGMFSYISPDKRVPQDHPLRMIRSLVDGDIEHSIAAVKGVRRASPLSFQYVQIPRGNKPIRLFLIGYKVGGVGGPPSIVAGRTITKK